jgi:hypothetical protein
MIMHLPVTSHHDDDQPVESQFACDMCGRVCEPEENAWGEIRVELQICSQCNRKFCGFCTYRIGGKEYCSRTCGARYFFGGDSDDDEGPVDD